MNLPRMCYFFLYITPYSVLKYHQLDILIKIANSQHNNSILISFISSHFTAFSLTKPKPSIRTIFHLPSVCQNHTNHYTTLCFYATAS